MKRIIIGLMASLALVSTTSSCKGYLNTEPSTALSTDKVLKERSLLQSTLNGLYDGLQGSNRSTSYYAQSFTIIGDVRGDDMQCPTVGSRGNAYYKMDYTRHNVYGPWYKVYSIIRSANRLLQMCDNLKQGASEKGLKEIATAKAQAQAVRALCYFDLCRVYAVPYVYSNDGTALGVPLVMSIQENSSMPGRNTLKECYDFIIKDLTEAIASNALEPTSFGYISQSAAKALLGRVYLYKGDKESNTQALKLSKEVIESNLYQLAETPEEYKQVWSESNSKEMIFSIVNFDSKDWADREGLAYVLHINGYYNAFITKKFYDEMMEDKDDIRWNVLWASKGSRAEEVVKSLPNANPTMKMFIGKYPGKASLKDMRTNDIPIIRLAEVYLNAAEAAFKIDDKATALKYLNVIVKRANKTKSVAESDLTLERILKERAKELVGEGHRFYDLMRNGLKCERFYKGSQGWHGALIPEAQSFDHTYFRTILPIPETETDVNPTLKSQQNPGY
ncbi:RagB/SusD family nutrient uptake outer membrane protein [Porphyromonas sp.]